MDLFPSEVLKWKRYDRSLRESQTKSGTSNRPPCLDVKLSSNDIWAKWLHELAFPFSRAGCFDLEIVKDQAQAAPPHGTFTCWKLHQRSPTWSSFQHGLFPLLKRCKYAYLKFASGIEYAQTLLSSTTQTQRCIPNRRKNSRESSFELEGKPFT